MELQSNGTVDWKGKTLICKCVRGSCLTSQERHSRHTNHFAHLAPTYLRNPAKNHDGRQTTLFPKGYCYAHVQNDAVDYLQGLGQGGAASLCAHWQLHYFLCQDRFEL